MNRKPNLEFILGVTGHRDVLVDSEEQIIDYVDSVLEALQSALGTFPLTVACGLADGSDRLVARRALAKEIPIRAILPMPKEHYIDDFSGKSLEEFEDILSNKNVSVTELPLPDNVTGSEFREGGAIRDESYADLRDWLVQHANLILGLWDGGMDRPKGGTTDVLLSYLFEREAQQGKEEISLNFDSDGLIPYSANVVAWVEVQRSGSTGSRLSLSYLAPSLDDRALIRISEMPESLLQRLTGLKGHSEALQRQYKKESPTSYSLFTGIGDDIPSGLSSSLERTDAQFKIADLLAIKDQESSGWLFKSFALLAATMGFLFLLYAKLIPVVGVVIAYLGLFAVAFMLFGQAGKKISFTRYLVHRVIAESLRIRFYMLLAGVEDEIKFQRVLSLSGIESIAGFAWLNDVLKISSNTDVDPPPASRARLLIVKQCWIDDQLSYFKSLVARLSKRTRRLGQVKTGLMCMNLFCLMMLIVFGNWLASVMFSENLTLKSFLIFILGLIPLWVGIWELYQNKMATRELLWQYKNQAEHFQRASKQMEGELSIEAMQKIITDLGERSLFETYQWTIHRYHRESEPPPTLFGNTGMAMFQGRVGAGRAKRTRTDQANT